MSKLVGNKAEPRQLRHRIFAAHVPRNASGELTIKRIARQLISDHWRTECVDLVHLHEFSIQQPGSEQGKCAAKTVADCFKYRNKIGLDVALEALKDAWRSRKVTMAELSHFAKINRVERVMQPYLEAVTQ